MPGKSRIAIPAREFFWTIDQIATMLSVEEAQLRTAYLYFDGRSAGTSRQRMIARNISPEEERPEWRVSHSEFTKWLRFRGIRYYDEGGFSG